MEKFRDLSNKEMIDKIMFNEDEKYLYIPEIFEIIGKYI